MEKGAYWAEACAKPAQVRDFAVGDFRDGPRLSARRLEAITESW
jgi:hypothetical protein